MTNSFDYAAHGLVASSNRPAIPGDAVQTVAEVLDPVLALDPDREALVGRHARYTYAELDRVVDAAAVALIELGVKPGDRVAASFANHTEIVVAFLAAMRCGAIWLGINRALAPPEKAFMLCDAQASLFLGDDEMAAQVESKRGGLPVLAHIIRAEPGDMASEWAGRLAAAAGAPRPSVVIDPFGPAAIAYTSGTTGFPKGAVHSQHNILLPGASRRLVNRDRRGFRTGVCLPLTLLNLMVLGPALVYQAGGCLVTMDRVDAVGVAGWTRDERINAYAVVPSILHDLLTRSDVKPSDLETLERLGVGGADCPESTRTLYHERFGRHVQISYGLTEAPTSVTHSEPDEPQVPRSCGKALPFVTVRVRGSDGEDVPVGEVGEVCIGPARLGPLAGIYTPMLGYWNKPDATADALRDGLFNTGDLASFDENGNLFIHDRRSDLILRGGANVYPAEVERVLAEDPRIAACAVLGCADARLGERVVAAVQLESGASVTGEELTELSRERLARYKVPSEFRFVTEFPRTPMGKIRKRDLRDLFIAS